MKRMYYRVWEVNGQWYWEVTNATGRRLASEAHWLHSREAAKAQAVAWIESHGGTVDDWE